jgi:RNA polymerase sigma-70 factor (ECF subfamily)
MAVSKSAKRLGLSGIGEADERRLVEAAQQDRARFAELYECHFDFVYAYLSRRTRDRAETEDLTAEVFRKALQNLTRFKWTGAPFGAWLVRIASNLIADRAKRAAKEGRVDTRPLMGGGAGSPAQQTDLEASQRRARLFSLVEELAEDQRRVVVARFAEEKSIAEIANELGRSEGAVKQLQFRALQNLRQRLGDELSDRDE